MRVIMVNMSETYRADRGGPLASRAGVLLAKMARQEGLEPPTSGLEGPCSIQLSY